MDDMTHKEVSIRGGGGGGDDDVDTYRAAGGGGGKRGTFGNGKEGGAVVHHTSVRGDVEEDMGSQERIVRSGEEGHIRATTEVRVEYEWENALGAPY